MMSDVKMADDESPTGKLCNGRQVVDELQRKKRSKVLGSIPDVHHSKFSSSISDENFFTYMDDMEEQDFLGENIPKTHHHHVCSNTNTSPIWS
jgi:hypothetical protein